MGLAGEPGKPAGRTIEVTGSATVDVTPDMVVMSLVIRNLHANVDRVADDHVALVSQVIAVVKAHQPADRDVQTSNMQFGEHRFFKGGDWVQDGFFASTEMRVTVRDLAKYVPLWKALVKTAGVSVARIQFDHGKRSRFQDEARESALLAGKKKAAAMAAALGCGIGDAIAIREGEVDRVDASSYARVTASNTFAPGAAEETTGTGGKLQIRAEVQLTFQLTAPAK
jgi:uncharacterized protein YggE